MSYFDHISCPNCNAMVDPEKMGREGLVCPVCKSDLDLKHLFGLAAAFDEEAPPNLTLDDLMSPTPGPSGSVPTPAAPKVQEQPAAEGSALDWMRKNRKP